MKFVRVVPCRYACVAVAGDAIPNLILNHQHPRLFQVLRQLLDVKADKAVVNVNRRSVVEEIERSRHIQVKRLCHAVGFRQMLRRQRGVEVREDRHILRARVCKVGLIDTLHSTVDHGALDGFQPGLAAHNQLTEGQHKIGFECQRVFVLGIVQVDVQRIQVIAAGGRELDNLPMQQLYQRRILALRVTYQHMIVGFQQHTDHFPLAGE